MQIDYSGKICIITGAASGIGEAIARSLIQRGASVALFDLDERLMQKFPETKTARTFVCDVTNQSIVKKYVDSAREYFGKLDFLFNCAGVGGTLPLQLATEKHWRRIVDLNLLGYAHMIECVLPDMLERGGGHILNVSSISGLIPYAGQALYATTKFGVTGMSLAMRSELKPSGVRVSLFCPGLIKTRIFYKPILGQEAPEEYVRIPAGCMDAEAAVKSLFKGLDSGKPIIFERKRTHFRYLVYRYFNIIV
jgi:NADP-dependent 3-hydroxy acid dehydrogenase YdfG